MSASLLQCCTNMAQLMECSCDVDEKGKKVIKEYKGI